MKYVVQSDETQMWVSGYVWDTDSKPYHWVISWCKDKKDAKKMDSLSISFIKDAIGKCSAYRAEIADTLAPDGIVDYGIRTVSKKGTIRFAGSKWQHEKLISLAGKKVLVQADDYWIQHPIVYFPPDFDHKNFICALDGVEKNS